MAHVLVVEDDPFFRDALGELLRLEGHTVEPASNGAMALRLLPHARPDLILLDLLMPEMDGWAFARAADADPQGQGIPIVLMSVSRRLDDALHDLAGTGVRDILRKPFGFDELAASLAKHLPPTDRLTCAPYPLHPGA